jgi:hypothetical protein
MILATGETRDDNGQLRARVENASCRAFAALRRDFVPNPPADGVVCSALDGSGLSLRPTILPGFDIFFDSHVSDRALCAQGIGAIVIKTMLRSSR